MKGIPLEKAFNGRGQPKQQDGTPQQVAKQPGKHAERKKNKCWEEVTYGGTPP